MWRLAIAVVLAGCGGRSRAAEPVAAPSADDPATIAKQVFEAQIAMTFAAEANVGDCGAMARALGMVFDDVRTLFERTTELRTDPELARRLNAEMVAYDEAAGTQAERMTRAVILCQRDPAMVDVMAKMPVLQ